MFLHRTFSLVVLLLCGIWAAPANAECVQAEAIVHQTYPTATHAGGSYRLDEYAIALPGGDADDAQQVVCKSWPAHPEFILALVPLMASGSDDEHSGDLDILVLDSKSLKVQQRVRLKGYMNDDAVRITGLALDTARYQLAPGTPAFGIRKTLEGSSRANPFGEVDLALFATIDGKLRAVLDGMVVSRNNGEWDTNCAGTFSDSHVVLTMGKTATHGLVDIDVAGTREESSNYLDKQQQCQEKKGTPGKIQAQLRYDGQKYVVPKDMVAL
ncbi:MAG TPA: hypothetical protein VIM98_01580 [Dyella sp.]|uniref:hypothetical protein n=1 Tax=Dyella sp. TaxID=1869338 RepID=UPI002F94B4B8